jgi:hypothetical protein
MDKEFPKIINFKWGRNGVYLKALKSDSSKDLAYRLITSDENPEVTVGYNTDGSYWVKVYGAPKLIEGQKPIHESFIVQKIHYIPEFGFIVFIEFLPFEEEEEDIEPYDYDATEY